MRRFAFLKGAAVLSLLAGGLLPTIAAAQNQPSGQSGPTREEIERADLPTLRRDDARLTVEVERAPCALDAPQFADVRVTLGEVVFEGLRGGASLGSLRPAYARFLGTAQPISVVCEIRDAAAAILRNQGYLATIQIPPQRIEDGVLQLNVLMGRLVSVRIRGDVGPAERTLAGYFERLTGQEVFNQRDAERYLLLARDLPGYDVRLALRSADTGPGELVGEVLVTRRTFDLDVNVQNYGSREVGPWGGLLRAQFYGLTGLADRTTLALFSTADFDEQQVVRLGHDMRVGADGLSVSGQFTYAWTRPDLGSANADVLARTLLATGEIGYQAIRSQRANVAAAVGLDFVNQQVEFASSRLSTDRLRVAFARLDFDAAAGQAAGFSQPEPVWRLAGSLEARRGLDILDASAGCGPAQQRCQLGLVPSPSRLEGDPTATLVRAAGTLEARPIPALTVALSPRAQYAWDPLLSFEEFSAGSYTVGRGYDPGAIVGDSGVGYQAELRLGGLLPRAADDFAVQPYAFADQAWVWNKDSEFNGRDPQKLASVGGGVRAAYGDRLRLDLAVAVPIRRVGLDNRRGDPRVLLSLSTRLPPWLGL